MDIHSARNMCPHGYMNVIGYPTVMINRSTSVYNRTLADNGIGINHGTSHYDGALTNFYASPNCGIRMNKGRQFAIDAFLNPFSRHGVADRDNVITAASELSGH